MRRYKEILKCQEQIVVQKIVARADEVKGLEYLEYHESMLIMSSERKDGTN